MFFAKDFVLSSVQRVLDVLWYLNLVKLRLISLFPLIVFQLLPPNSLLAHSLITCPYEGSYV